MNILPVPNLDRILENMDPSSKFNCWPTLLATGDVFVAADVMFNVLVSTLRDCGGGDVAGGGGGGAGFFL